MNSEVQKKRLLVVEDDEDSQKFLQLFLKRKFEIEISYSAKTFYDKLEKNNIDLILMDVSLRGEKDGLQLTKEVKSNDKYKHIPIVALTAHAYQKDRTQALRAGVDYFLTKPVKNELLLETLLQAAEDSER